MVVLGGGGGSHERVSTRYLSRANSTHEGMRTRDWSWLSSESPSTLSRCFLFARQRTSSLPEPGSSQASQLARSALPLCYRVSGDTTSCRMTGVTLHSHLSRAAMVTEHGRARLGSAMVGVPHCFLLPSYMQCHGRSSPSTPPTLTTHISHLPRRARLGSVPIVASIRRRRLLPLGPWSSHVSRALR